MAKEYVPRYRSAAFALLVTLLRERRAGRAVLTKAELMRAANASRLTDTPMDPQQVRAARTCL